MYKRNFSTLVLLLITIFSISISNAENLNACDNINGNWKGSWIDRIDNNKNYSADVRIYQTPGVVHLDCRLSNNMTISYFGSCDRGKLTLNPITSGYYGILRGIVVNPNQLKFWDLDFLYSLTIFKI